MLAKEIKKEHGEADKPADVAKEEEPLPPVPAKPVEKEVDKPQE